MRFKKIVKMVTKNSVLSTGGNNYLVNAVRQEKDKYSDT